MYFWALFVLLAVASASAQVDILANTCGGIIDDGVSGGINYKINENYGERENCLWAVNVENKTEVEIQMLEDGFISDDPAKGLPYVNIYKIGLDGDSFELVVRLEGGNRNLTSFITRKSVFLVQFSSGGGKPGTGFALTYEGTGDSRYSYYDFKFNGPVPSGNSIYPDFQNPPNVYFRTSTTIIMPEEGKAIELTFVSPTVVLQASGLTSHICYENSLAVYEFNPIKPRLALSFCRADRRSNHTVLSVGPILIQFNSVFGYDGGDSQYQIAWESVNYTCPLSLFC